MNPQPGGRYLSFILYLDRGETHAAFRGRITLTDGSPVNIRKGVFTVRVWSEPGGRLVRGAIYDAQTGQVLRFQSGDRVAEFISRCLAKSTDQVELDLNTLTSRGISNMPENILLNTSVTVPNGPKITLNRTLTIEAYDKIDVTIPAGAAGKVVELLPSTAAGRVLFLMVASDWYGETLSYKVNAPAGTSFVLDEPHLLMGKGALVMLDPATPEKLLFDNTSAQDAKVQILTGRDATP